MLFALTFILAFCSIVYELLLGQTLSAFLGNTVLRYSVTIGLYMFAMGAGALYFQHRGSTRPVVALQVIELLLTVIGGLAVLGLFLIDGVSGTDLAVWVCAHGLIIVIGFLTGIELPLLIQIRNLDRPDSESKIIGVDYIGAFAGTMAFAFYFYPTLGLIPSAFSVALLNALVGMLLVSQAGKVGRDSYTLHRGLALGHFVLCLVYVAGLLHGADVSDIALDQYLQTHHETS